ncbi:Uncharacterized protein Fot_41486 [Forsythia ovata]|uniref:Uncharacterized protein n=1 Tax=Forsythia ovata TaxID=205694 RepID=A0ABD1RID8_9LAMI
MKLESLHLKEGLVDRAGSASILKLEESEVIQCFFRQLINKGRHRLHFLALRISLSPLSLSEDVYISKFFQKNPDSKHEDPIKKMLQTNEENKKDTASDLTASIDISVLQERLTNMINLGFELWFVVILLFIRFGFVNLE